MDTSSLMYQWVRRIHRPGVFLVLFDFVFLKQ